MDAAEFQPPEPVVIARRSLILSGIVCRASLENYADEEYKRETAALIHSWFDELGLWPYLEPCEEEIVRCPFDKMPKRLVVRGTWFVEGIAVLAWALNRHDFPPHDQKVDPVAITNALDFLDPSAEQLLTSPSARNQAELKAAREWSYDLHCTLRGFLHHGGDGRLAPWIGDYLATLGLEPHTVMKDGILTVAGKPIVETARDELLEWENVISEKHRAAIWLEGRYPLYTELPVDT